jgi:hypothetical protein
MEQTKFYQNLSSQLGGETSTWTDQHNGFVCSFSALRVKNAENIGKFMLNL